MGKFNNKFNNYVNLFNDEIKGNQHSHEPKPPPPPLLPLLLITTHIQTQRNLIGFLCPVSKQNIGVARGMGIFFAEDIFTRQSQVHLVTSIQFGGVVMLSGGHIIVIILYRPPL